MLRQISGTALLIALLCGSPALGQQDPNDLGAADTIRLELSQSQSGGVCRITADVYFFNDQQELMGAQVVFAWKYPGLEFDTMLTTPTADSAFEIRVGFKKQLADSIDCQSFGGANLEGDGLMPAPTARRMCSMHFHINQWNPGDIVSFDTTRYKYAYTLFAPLQTSNYVPIWPGPVSIVLDSVMTAVDQPGDRETLPGGFNLSQNYPNPFNPSTAIDYSLPRVSEVELAVFNQLGQKVAVLVNGVQSAGRYHAVWNGCNAAGEPVSSGVYLYRLTAGEFTQSRKMLLLK